MSGGRHLEVGGLDLASGGVFVLWCISLYRYCCLHPLEIWLIVSWVGAGLWTVKTTFDQKLFHGLPTILMSSCLFTCEIWRGTTRMLVTITLAVTLISQRITLRSRVIWSLLWLWSSIFPALVREGRRVKVGVIQFVFYNHFFYRSIFV